MYVLLVMLMLSAAARLWITDWTPDLGLVQSSALIGSILGLALGYSVFKRGPTWLLIAGYSAVILPGQWLRIIESKESAWQRLASVGGRLGHALSEIAARQPVEDFIFFVALMSLLFWSITLFGGYQLARKQNLLAAIVPAGMAIVIIELYDHLESERILYLGVYLLLSLILIGRHNLIKNNAAWQVQGVASSSETSIDISTGMVIASVALLIGAWLIPLDGYSFEPVQRAWNKVDARFAATRERIRDALAAVENYIPSGGGTAFGAEMSLGRTAAQGNALLFSVEAPAGLAQRYYWRARIYDTYSNGTWQNSRTSEKIFAPEDDPTFNRLDSGTRTITLIFVVNQSQSTLLAINDPLWTSRAATATFADTGTSDRDLITLRASSTVLSGERYESQSAVRGPTIVELRAAGTDYPAWVQERYLQLPANLPRKIGALAEEITAAAGTPYDQAAAITNYLRNNITYKDTLDSSDPFGGDPIAWMLFNSREGFCNYYASAEVLMLRSLGIPARLAVGYAQGEKTDTAYRVRNKDTHAWPEVYFPGIGWVEFEPTTAQPQLARPLGETITSSPIGIGQPTPPGPDGGHEPVEDTAPPPATVSDQFIQRVRLWVIIFIIGGVWVGFLIYLNRRQPLRVRLPRALAWAFNRNHLNLPLWLQDWLRWAEQTPAERSFEAINLCLRLLGKPQPIHATPGERAALLSDLLPEAAAAIDQLTQQHVAALFSPETAAGKNAWQATLSVYIFTLRRYLHFDVR